MALLKNKGPMLVSEYYGNIEQIPPEYRSKIGIRRRAQEVPIDILPDLLIDPLVQSQVVQERTDERLKTNFEFIGDINTPLEDEVFIKETCQIGHHTRTLVSEGTDLPTPNCLLWEANQHNLGNGMLDQNVVTVDEAYPARRETKQRPDVTPQDFAARLQTDVAAFTDCDPYAPPDDLLDGQYESTNEEDGCQTKHTLRSRDLLSLPKVNANSRTNRYKQVEQVNRWLESDTTTPAAPTALRDVEFTKLGDGTALEVRTVIDELFDQHVYAREKPDIAPEWAKALLPIFEESFLETDDAVDPDPLASGVLSERQQQEDVFNRRVSRRSRDLIALPVQRVGYRTNRYKQVETVTDILEDDSTVPAVPTELRDVTFEVLGDGSAVEQRVEIDEIFAGLSSSTEVPDLLPEIFRALLETHVREFTVTDLVDDPPTLALGDFERTETQVDEFNKRVHTRGRAGITYPQTVTVLRHTTEEYGGEITKLEGFLDDSEPSVEEGLTIVNSEVKDLGNGTWFRQSEKLNTATEWPELVGTEVDPRTGIAVEVRKKVVVAGTTGGIGVDGYVDVKSIDKWRSIRIASKLTPGSLPAPVTWETSVEHRFPNTLLSFMWLWAAASAPFAYDFDMVPVMDVLEGYAGPCRAKITESFTIGAPTDVITPTVFCPQGHMVGYSWAYAADPSDECGSCVGIARATARAWPIPPSLHAALDISGGVTLTGGTYSDTLPATVPTALPAAGTLITKACDVERWRFGVFYRRLTEIYVPAC